MKSKAAREKRQAWLSRREMDAASDGGSAPITTGAERAGALTQVMTETTGISPITTCNDAKPELIASTARNLVLRIKPDMASQQIDKRGNDLKAAASPKKSIDTASISLSEPQSRPPGISRNVTTPMENAIAKTEHSGAAPTPHGTIGNGCQSLENKRPESEARELSAGEKVFGIVELGEAILYKVSMRRLFLLRRVSKSFQNLIDNFTTLKASMFLVCLATRSDGSKDNPLAFSWSQRLPLFDPFEITRSGYKHYIDVRVRLHKNRDLLRVHRFVASDLTGSWIETALTYCPYMPSIHFTVNDGAHHKSISMFATLQGRSVSPRSTRHGTFFGGEPRATMLDFARELQALGRRALRKPPYCVADNQLLGSW